MADELTPGGLAEKDDQELQREERERYEQIDDVLEQTDEDGADKPR